MSFVATTNRHYRIVAASKSNPKHDAGDFVLRLFAQGKFLSEYSKYFKKLNELNKEGSTTSCPLCKKYFEIDSRPDTQDFIAHHPKEAFQRFSKNVNRRDFDQMESFMEPFIYTVALISGESLAREIFAKHFVSPEVMERYKKYRPPLG